MYKKIVIKIGSGVISKDGQLNSAVVESIVDQIVVLRKKNIEVILVTSGAVATGKGLIKLKEDKDSIVQKQVFASVGQVKLMSIYAELFGRHGFTCAQVLVTKEDFRDRQHYLNMKNCLQNLLQDNIIPIINENDVIAITELIFTDNDELAALVASQLGVDAVVILTSVDGVLTGDPKDPKSKVIREINFGKDTSSEDFITNDKSTTGRGGMHTKFAMARKLTREGIATYIANGSKSNILTELVIEGNPIGTKFVPSKRLSSIKRRIAHSDGLSRGIIYVNKCAKDVLLSSKPVSLLPVGIIKVSGDFKKGDIVEIRDENSEGLGFGITQYDSNKTGQFIGKKGMKAIIHYDYMFIGY